MQEVERLVLECKLFRNIIISARAQALKDIVVRRHDCSLEIKINNFPFVILHVKIKPVNNTLTFPSCYLNQRLCIQRRNLLNDSLVVNQYG